jgi:hypothetical protein
MLQIVALAIIQIQDGNQQVLIMRITFQSVLEITVVFPALNVILILQIALLVALIVMNIVNLQ